MKKILLGGYKGITMRLMAGSTWHAASTNGVGEKLKTLNIPAGTQEKFTSFVKGQGKKVYYVGAVALEAYMKLPRKRREELEAA